MAERWGRSVFHCPFCHGWEVRDRPLGVLDRGDSGVHRALLLRDVERRRHAAHQRTGRARRRRRASGCAQAGIAVDERPVARLAGPGEELDAVVFADGDRASRASGLLVPAPLHQRSDLAEQLGAAAGEPESRGDRRRRASTRSTHTSVPGVFAAGDLSTQMPQVAGAIAAGSMAAAMVVQTLVFDEGGATYPPGAATAAPPAS